MSDPHTLLIPLIGPMQSWGYRSRFDDRDTSLEPTRSGLIGLLCSALGWPRETDLIPFHSLRMGVRIDAPGRVMTDYHTAKDVMRAGGGTANTVQSRRHYLADARFLAGLEGDDVAFLQMLESALRNPVWTLSLGRKSFPLSEPPYLPGGSIFRGNIEAAFKQVSCRKPRGWQGTEIELRYVVEAEAGDMTLTDVPRDFASRRFDTRRVVHQNVSCRPEEELCIYRD